MKFYDIMPTQDSVLRTLEENQSGRNTDVLAFISLLNSLDASSSIALDAPWGAGKTFLSSR